MLGRVDLKEEVLGRHRCDLPKVRCVFQMDTEASSEVEQVCTHTRQKHKFGADTGVTCSIFRVFIYVGQYQGVVAFVIFCAALGKI